LKDLGRLFSKLTGQKKKDVFLIHKEAEYEHLREFSGIQGVATFGHTMVMQVDEYWAKLIGPLSLRGQHSYLKATTADGERNVKRFEDPFAVFQPTDADADSDEDAGGRCSREGWTRADLFAPVGYDMQMNLDRLKSVGERTANSNNEDNGENDRYAVKGRESVVKVPLSWDFGFLMFLDSAWKAATKLGGQSVITSDVFRNLQRQIEEPVQGHQWRPFLEACVDVARCCDIMSFTDGKPLRPFGISPVRDETLSCLVLEIWASEISMITSETVFAKYRHDHEIHGFNYLIEQFEKQLFKTWLLLTEVFSPSDFDKDVTLKTSGRGCSSAGSAVAERHWYATAAEVAGINLDGYRPAGLPGNYSMRGDWFLGVARGSRSYRMGERAIDLLTTRRGNIVRLQQGIGLPVRGCSPADAAELWTPIPWVGSGRKSAEFSYGPNVSYAELRNLGARDDLPGGDGRGREGFNWLWRSRIEGYERDARLWRRWLCSLLMDLPPEMRITRGFDLYDMASSGGKPQTEEYNRIWEQFQKRTQAFRGALSRAKRMKVGSTGVD
jgi:hypothetical protein